MSLAVIGGVAASLSVSATPLFAIALLVSLLLVALETIEPLSQEVDHPDRTDGLPLDRGHLFAHHLVAPAGLLVIAGLIGATTATILDPTDAAFAFGLAIPVVWGGAIGAVITTVRDAAPPIDGRRSKAGAADTSSLIPPEFAGFQLVLNAVLPIVFTAVGVIPVVSLYFLPDPGSAVRSSLAVLLAVAASVLWVIRRDRWSAAINGFFADGREAAKSGSNPYRTESK